MATVGGATVFTMADFLKGLTPDGKVAQTVEALNEVNEFMPDVMWKEGNLLTGHMHSVRSGLPAATWRRLNYGVQQTKSRKVQVTDACGMLEMVSAVDERLVNLGGNEAEVRWDEDLASMEGLAQDATTAFFYSNEATDPEQITGLTPRYSALSGAENSTNIINAGGTGSDNTSIWLVGWGVNKVFGIYPKGSPMGLRHYNQGKVELTDADGGTYMGYKSRFYWDLGVAVADWRYAVRICNIDISLLVADKGTVSSGADLIAFMIRALHKIPNLKNCKPVFYMNEDILTYLDLQTYKQTNMNVKYTENPHGEWVWSFRGVPIRQVDKLVNTETVVS